MSNPRTGQEQYNAHLERLRDNLIQNGVNVGLEDPEVDGSDRVSVRLQGILDLYGGFAVTGSDSSLSRPMYPMGKTHVSESRERHWDEYKEFRAGYLGVRLDAYLIAADTITKEVVKPVRVLDSIIESIEKSRETDGRPEERKQEPDAVDRFDGKLGAGSAGLVGGNSNLADHDGSGGLEDDSDGSDLRGSDDRGAGHEAHDLPEEAENRGWGNAGNGFGDIRAGALPDGGSDGGALGAGTGSTEGGIDSGDDSDVHSGTGGAEGGDERGGHQEENVRRQLGALVWLGEDEDGMDLWGNEGDDTNSSSSSTEDDEEEESWEDSDDDDSDKDDLPENGTDSDDEDSEESWTNEDEDEESTEEDEEEESWTYEPVEDSASPEEQGTDEADPDDDSGSWVNEAEPEESAEEDEEEESWANSDDEDDEEDADSVDASNSDSDEDPDDDSGSWGNSDDEEEDEPEDDGEDPDDDSGSWSNSDDEDEDDDEPAPVEEDEEEETWSDDDDDEDEPEAKEEEEYEAPWTAEVEDEEPAPVTPTPSMGGFGSPIPQMGTKLPASNLSSNNPLPSVEDALVQGMDAVAVKAERMMKNMFSKIVGK